MNSQAVCVLDGLTDDYECWDGGLPGITRKNETFLYVPDLQVLDA